MRHREAVKLANRCLDLEAEIAALRNHLDARALYYDQVVGQLAERILKVRLALEKTLPDNADAEQQLRHLMARGRNGRAA